MHQAYQDDIQTIYNQVGSGPFLWGFVGIRKKPEWFESRYLIIEDTVKLPLLNQKIWRLTPHTLNQCRVKFGPEPVHAKKKAEAALHQKIVSVRKLKVQYMQTSRGRI